MESKRIASTLIPVASAALLVFALVAGGLTTRDVPGTAEFHLRVRDAVRAIPLTIGDWVGRDADPEASALEILDPVVIMQRVYRNQNTGETLSLLVVYCDDTRNLYGHYPPVCYPNARGWTAEGTREEVVQILDREFPATSYAFGRVSNGIDRDLSVLNFMVSPSLVQPVLENMDALTRSRPSRFTPGLGAGQVQILGLDALSEQSRQVARQDFLRALQPAISVIAEGA